MTITEVFDALEHSAVISIPSRSELNEYLLKYMEQEVRPDVPIPTWNDDAEAWEI